MYDPIPVFGSNGWTVHRLMKIRYISRKITLNTTVTPPPPHLFASRFRFLPHPNNPHIYLLLRNGLLKIEIPKLIWKSLYSVYNMIRLYLCFIIKRTLNSIRFFLLKLKNHSHFKHLKFLIYRSMNIYICRCIIHMWNHIIHIG